jgi:hypothetical protein
MDFRMGKPTFDSRNSKTLGRQTFVCWGSNRDVRIQTERFWISGYQEKV